MAIPPTHRWRRLATYLELNTPLRYTAALVISLACIALRWLMGHFVINDGLPYASLFIPVTLSAFFGGLGPGLVSLLTTIGLADFFLIPPLYTIGLNDSKAAVGTLLFALSGLVVSVVGELGRNAILQASSDADVSKVAQQHSMASQERLSIAEQVVAGGVWDWDLVTGSLYWTDGYRRLFDYPLHERPSREKWLDGLHPEDRERVTGTLDELFRRSLQHWSMEHRICTASGRMRWIASQGHVYYDDAGRPKRMVGIDLDVTARRLVEEAARSNEAKLRLLMQYARVGDWEWNPQDGSMRCSPEFYDVLGLNPTVSPSFDSLMAFVHPADDRRIRDLLEDLREHPGRDFEFENRFIGSDGVERLIHTRGAVIRDNEGDSVRLVGVTIDMARPGNELLAS
jgi:PAS domain-containing protein